MLADYERAAALEMLEGLPLREGDDADAAGDEEDEDDDAFGLMNGDDDEEEDDDEDPAELAAAAAAARKAKGAKGGAPAKPAAKAAAAAPPAAAAKGGEAGWEAAIVAQIKAGGGTMALAEVGNKCKKPADVKMKLKQFITARPKVFAMDGNNVKLTK